MRTDQPAFAQTPAFPPPAFEDGAFGETMPGLHEAAVSGEGHTGKMDFGRTLAAFEETQAKNETHIRALADTYADTPSAPAVEREMSFAETAAAFIEEFEREAKQRTWLGEEYRLDPSLGRFRAGLTQHIRNKNIPPEILERHPRLLASLPAVVKIALLSTHYPSMALSALAAMPNQPESASERFTAAETLANAHPGYIKYLSNLGFSPADRDEMVARATRADPTIAFAMREQLEQPYKQDEVEALLSEELKVFMGAKTEQRKASFWRVSAIVRAAAWPTQTTTMFLEGKGIFSKSLLSAIQGIPSWEGAKPWFEAQSLLRGRESEDAIVEKREQMLDRFEERSAKINNRLIATLEKAQPERHEKLKRLRDQTAALHDGAVLLVDSVGRGSITAPLRLKIENIEQPVVYKTPQREPKSIDEIITPEERARLHAKNIRTDGPLKEGIPGGEAFKREWLCKLIDTTFGLGLVPPTVLRRGPEGVGSVQSWEGGYPAHMVNWRERLTMDKKILLALFDYLVQHCDRHDGNFLVSPDGEAIAIDNGFSFSTAPKIKGDDRHQLHSLACVAAEGKDVPMRVRRQLRRTVETPEIRKVLEEAFEHAFGPHGKRMFQEFLGRVDMMAPKDEKMPAKIPPTVW